MSPSNCLLDFPTFKVPIAHNKDNKDNFGGFLDFDYLLRIIHDKDSKSG